MILRVVARRGRTGPEPASCLALRANDVVAGRYVVLAALGASSFSTTHQALDTKAAALVCLKVMHNRKSAFDAALDEVRVLRAVAAADPGGTSGCVRMLDFFYYREHFFLVTELLRANLHQVATASVRVSGGGGGSGTLRAAASGPYFTLPRVAAVARQLLRSLAFLHSLGIAHADVKPENVLLKSAAACEVALIDFGSATYVGADPPSSYMQSRAYRAPEVVLGCPYDGRIDVWSVGCVVAELIAGRVLFASDSGGAPLLARVTGIVGPPPAWMRARGTAAHRFYTPSGALFERAPGSGRAAVLRPKRSSLAARVRGADAGALSFLAAVLTVDAARRPTAAEALAHPGVAEGGGGGGVASPDGRGCVAD
jgi:serine/threonine protein kinase